jgi:hypothetical protein
MALERLGGSGMTGPEALQAMRDGKRIRRGNWPDGQYLMAKPEKYYRCWAFYMNSEIDGIEEERTMLHGEPWILGELMEDDWEVVE